MPFQLDSNVSAASGLGTVTIASVSALSDEKDAGCIEVESLDRCGKQGKYARRFKTGSITAVHQSVSTGK